MGEDIRLRRSRRGLFTRAAAVCALSALALSGTGPAMADAGPPDSPQGGGTGAPVTPGGPEQTAQQQAEDSGQPVVVDDLTTQTDQTVANPDGTFTRTSYVEPVRVLKAGGWTAVDATLTANTDGTYSAAATPGRVTVSGGGTGPLVTLSDDDGHLLSFTFPVALPAPTVSGDTAEYDGVLPGVDLRATVTDQGGFGEVLIVHDAAAAADPRLRSLRLATTTQGLDLSADEAGNIAARRADGTAAYTSPTPLMWDSSTHDAQAGARSAESAHAAVTGGAGDPAASSADGPGDSAQVQPVAVATAPGSVELTPDADLLTGPTTTYPVYIDPSTSPVTLTTGHYTEVAEGCPGASLYDDPQDNGEGVGYQQYASNCFGMEQSYYAIDTSGLKDSMIFDSATLHLTETYGADHGCSNTWPLTLKTTGAISDGTDWNHQPGVTATVQTQQVKTAAAGCGAQSVNFDVTSQIADAAGHQSSWTFGLFGDTGRTQSNLGYMRFSVNPWITAVYDIPPYAPTQVSTTPDSLNPSGAACGGGTAGWIGRTTLVGGNSNITLNAQLSSPMQGANLHAKYKVWDNQTPGDGTASKTTYPADSPTVASGGTAHSNIGITVQDGHQYGWSVLADDGHHMGPWTDGCHFNVDLAPPSPAHFTDSAAFPPLGGAAVPTAHAGDGGLTIHVTSTDTAPTGCAPYACIKSGIRRFEYSMDVPIPPTGAASKTVTPAANGSASADIPISVTAQQWGTHTLYVQAVDGAGNASPVTYSFFAPWNPDSQNLVQPGDLNGDGVPDTITPATDGTLQLVPGDGSVSATPQTVSGAADAPDCPTDDPGCHPARPGWSNFLVTHRGSYTQGGVDDLLAYSRNTKTMYIYVNDASGLTGPDRGPVSGHFTKGDVIALSLKPPCDPGADCGSYDTTWGSVSQILAAGDPDDSDGPPDLITVENGHLWYYAGSRNAATYLSGAKLLGAGDWTNTTLIAPGAVDGKLTLWARDNTTGLVHSYPVPLGADGLPTVLLTPPAHSPLVSGVTTAGTGPLCADVTHANNADGTRIQLSGCNSTAAQTWTPGTDNTVRAMGRCLDAADGGTADGTPVQLYQCNATAAQQWIPQADGSLKNPVSGRCLTDPADSTAAGTQLVLRACAAAGTPGQRWAADTTGTHPAQQPLLPLNLTGSGYPVVTSPGDANTPGSAAPGARDGHPDLYVVTNRNQVIEYPGAPTAGGLAQFTAPVTLGYTSGHPADSTEGDLNGDGTPDLAAVDTDGHLRIYSGTSSGRQNAGARSVGIGWTGADISHRGDFTGDGYEDLIAHLPGAAALRLYRGDGAAGNAEAAYTTIPRPAGSPSPDWSATTQVIAAGDVTLDPYPDLLAVENNNLYLFPGLGGGKVGTPVQIGLGGWRNMQLLAPGDVNGDGLNDLWGRDRTTGEIIEYLNDPDSSSPGSALGQGSRAVTIRTGFTASGFPSITSAGDADGDGHPDLWAAWTSDDHLHFYRGTGVDTAGTDSVGFKPPVDVSGGGWTTTVLDLA